VIMIHLVSIHPMNMADMHPELDSLEAAEVVEAAAVAVDAEGDTVVETKAVMEGMAATEE